MDANSVFVGPVTIGTVTFLTVLSVSRTLYLGAFSILTLEILPCPILFCFVKFDCFLCSQLFAEEKMEVK